MVIKAAIGSTTPDSVPAQKAFPRPIPSWLRRGREMMAPSGKFCMAIPRDSAMAEARVMLPSWLSMPANTTPTAIPSGMLWRVTARTSMVVLGSAHRRPSGASWSEWRWGMRRSSASRKAIPSKKQRTAGKKARRFRWPAGPFGSGASVLPGEKRHSWTLVKYLERGWRFPAADSWGRNSFPRKMME